MLLMKMLVITQELHLNILFPVKSLYVEYNIHSVALHLFVVLLLAYFWTKWVDEAVGTNELTPSRVGWLTRSCLCV